MEYFRILHKHIPYTCRTTIFDVHIKISFYSYTSTCENQDLSAQFSCPMQRNIYWKRHTGFFAVVSLGRHATYIVDTICIYYATYQMNTDPHPWLQQYFNVQCTAYHLVQLRQYCNAHCASSCTASTILQCAQLIILYSFDNIAMRTVHHLVQLQQYCNAHSLSSCTASTILQCAMRTTHHLKQLQLYYNAHCVSSCTDSTKLQHTLCIIILYSFNNVAMRYEHHLCISIWKSFSNKKEIISSYSQLKNCRVSANLSVQDGKHTFFAKLTLTRQGV